MCAYLPAWLPVYVWVFVDAGGGGDEVCVWVAGGAGTTAGCVWGPWLNLARSLQAHLGSRRQPPVPPSAPRVRAGGGPAGGARWRGGEGRVSAGRNPPGSRGEGRDGEDAAEAAWGPPGDRGGVRPTLKLFIIRSFLRGIEDALSLPPRAPALLGFLSGKCRKVVSKCQWLPFPPILHVLPLPK